MPVLPNLIGNRIFPITFKGFESATDSIESDFLIICSKPNFFMTSDFITLQVAPESRTILMAFSYMVTIACNEGLRLTRLFWFELPVATCQTESVLGLAPPFWSVGFSLYSSVDLLCGRGGPHGPKSGCFRGRGGSWPAPPPL